MTEHKLKSVSFYCYHTMFTWLDGQLPRGTAGAEEAVVVMARLLAAKGWNVRVFNNCGTKSQTVNYVRYLPVRACDPATYSDITVIWRTPRILDHKINAKKIYLWLHDHIDADELNEKRLRNLTKVMCHTGFHDTLLPHVPKEKILLTNNGIDVKAFAKLLRPPGVVPPRNMKKCIYTSAPDRGLECLLRLWPRIRDIVPNAELHLFYGWDVWSYSNGHDKQKLAWKESVISLMRQPGIMTTFEHKLPELLWDDYLTSGVWLYPTEWHESCCISAMKAQACGAFPVTTNVAALDRTVQWGTKIAANDIYRNEIAQRCFVESTIAYLTKPDERCRRQMMEGARQRFSWDKIAEQWDREFRNEVKNDHG